jgi:hypothetical protein
MKAVHRAKQMIVTTTTLLAEPESIPIPFSSMVITGGVALKAFTITWTFLTVLWFMQILPKHMAAMNSDRYLERTRKLLFPLVEIVRQSGIHNLTLINFVDLVDVRRVDLRVRGLSRVNQCTKSIS